MNKLFNRIVFANGTTPALNDANLNAITKAIDDIDNRVLLFADDILVDIPAIKSNLSTIQSAITEANAKIPIINADAESASASADEAQEWAEKAEEWAKTAQTTEVIVTPIITTGTHIADITVNGTKKELYCSGGGGGGASSYAELSDKPSINSVTLEGSKSLADLGIASASDLTALSNLVGQANALLEEV